MNTCVCVRHDELIQKLTRDGKTAKEIALIIGASEDSVRKYRIKHGYKKPKKEYIPKKKKHINGEAVNTLISQGKTLVQIAEEMGCTANQVKYFCKKNGIKLRGKKIPFYTEKSALADLESGIRVSEIAQKYSISIPMVYKLAGGMNKYKEKHACKVCGNLTYNPVFCSYECGRKVYVRIDHAKRRTRIKNAVVDTDISLEKLEKQEGCICYICGLKTNRNDFEIKNGAFICGNLYPSIDHVVPLTKGGAHSWANIRLAHRVCNSRKGDRIYGR